MKIGIEGNLIRYCLRNAYFITGTAYAGKSTMVKMLAEKHNMIFCGENYHDTLAGQAATVEKQPNLCYFQTMRDWQEFLNRTPGEYDRWIAETSREAGEIELVELLRLSASGRKIIVDTNIPLNVLREVSEYSRVAVMVCPQSLSVEHFFDREDPEKRFLLSQIQQAEDPAKTMANFRGCIARVNSKEHYDEYVQSCFFVLERRDMAADTKKETLAALESHFGLTQGSPD